MRYFENNGKDIGDLGFILSEEDIADFFGINLNELTDEVLENLLLDYDVDELSEEDIARNRL